MPQFEVQVKVTKHDTYTVFVDADSEGEAENLACGRWRENVSEFFGVDKPDEWEVLDCTQLTFECAECNVAISEAEASRRDGLCPACDVRLRDEEIAYWNETPERVASAFKSTLQLAVMAGREVFDPTTHRQWKLRTEVQR